jgi:hypothetical protein
MYALHIRIKRTIGYRPWLIHIRFLNPGIQFYKKYKEFKNYKQQQQAYSTKADRTSLQLGIIIVFVCSV